MPNPSADKEKEEKTERALMLREGKRELLLSTTTLKPSIVTPGKELGE